MEPPSPRHERSTATLTFLARGLLIDNTRSTNSGTLSPLARVLLGTAQGPENKVREYFRISLSRRNTTHMIAVGSRRHLLAAATSKAKVE